MSDWTVDPEAGSELDTYASTDDTIGDHDAIVESAVQDEWPSGDPRVKVMFNLLTANMVKADCTFSKPLSKEEVATVKAAGDKRKALAANSNNTKIQQLADFYKIAPPDIKEGMKFRVKTARSKKDEVTGKGGWLRVVAFKPKDEIGKSGPAPDADAPF